MTDPADYATTFASIDADGDGKVSLTESADHLAATARVTIEAHQQPEPWALPYG